MHHDRRTIKDKSNSSKADCTRSRDRQVAARRTRKLTAPCKYPSTKPTSSASTPLTNDDIATRLNDPTTQAKKDKEHKEHRNVLPKGHRVNEYIISHVIGRGGFGITYCAHHIKTNEVVAIKEFLPNNLAVRDENACVQPLSAEYQNTYQHGLARFIDEARILSRFNHPNIVTLKEVFTANNTGYMVMDYLKGETLSQAFKTGRVGSEKQLLCILKAMMNALDTVHGKGLIHRDIKPSNIFITIEGRPVLIDFGSARQAYSTQTQTLTAMVSPGYAPFEQYHMTHEQELQGPWTDIYALACTLYRGVAGRCYSDAIVIAHDKLAGKPVEKSPATLAGAGRYSKCFLHSIDVAMRFRGKDRPQTIGQWRQQFAKAEPKTATLVEYAEKIELMTFILPSATQKIRQKSTDSHVIDKIKGKRNRAWYSLASFTVIAGVMLSLLG